MKKNNSIKKMALTFVTWCSLYGFTYSQNNFIDVPADLPFYISLEKDVIDDNVGVGDRVKFSVDQPLSIKNTVVIRSKAIAYGKVVKNDGYELEIELESVQSITDTPIDVRGTLKRERKSRKRPIIIPANTIAAAYIKANTHLILGKP